MAVCTSSTLSPLQSNRTWFTITNVFDYQHALSSHHRHLHHGSICFHDHVEDTSLQRNVSMCCETCSVIERLSWKAAAAAVVIHKNKSGLLFTCKASASVS
jgi:hypothetical protein